MKTTVAGIPCRVSTRPGETKGPSRPTLMLAKRMGRVIGLMAMAGLVLWLIENFK